MLSSSAPSLHGTIDDTFKQNGVILHRSMLGDCYPVVLAERLQSK